MTHTSSRTWQWLGIILVLITLGAGYWYFAVRAGVKTNTTAGQTAGANDPANGLAAYWRFDENTGTSTTDGSVNGATGTLTNGPTWTTGQIGYALDFDGTNDYVTAPDADPLELALERSRFTIAGWFNRDTFTTDDTIVAKRNGITAAEDGYVVYVDDATDLLIFEFSDGVDEYQLASTSTFTATGWNHFVVTMSPSSGDLTMYINGLPDSPTVTGNINDMEPVGNALAQRIGAESDGGNPFDGKIDEVRYYPTRAFTAEQAAELYRLTSPTGVDTSLKGYWSFDATERGDYVYDQSGGANRGTPFGTGTLPAPTPIAGRVGQAMSFDGVDDYIGMGSPANLDDISNLTVCLWANVEDAGDGTLVAKDASSTGWQFMADGANELLTVFSGWSGGLGYAQWNTATGSLPKNKWTHLCMVYNRTSTANDPTVYINAVSVAVTETQSPSGTMESDAPMDVNIGSYDNGVSNFFDGNIDEVRIYNRLFTAAEIKALYDRGTPNLANTGGTQPQGGSDLAAGLALYWPLDEGTGTNADDKGVGQNDGTLTNGPTWTTGQIGSAVDFDGTNDYVAVADPASGILDFALPSDNGNGDIFSVSLWFNRDTATTDDTLVAKKDDPATGDGYVVYIDDVDDKIYAKVQSTTNTPDISQSTSTTTYTTTGWHHLVVMFDEYLNPSGFFQCPRIFVDGVDVTDTGSCASYLHYVDNIANTLAFTVGAESDGGNPFDGKLDDVRVYTRPLTNADVNLLYRATVQTSGIDTGLRGYWSLDGSDTSASLTSWGVYDRSGLGNWGAVTSSPVAVRGRVGQAIQFDGANDYITMGDVDALDGLTTTSWSAWIKTTATTEKHFIDKSFCGGTSGDGPVDFGVNFSTVGKVAVYLANGSTVSGVVEGAIDVNDGEWHMATFTYDGSTILIYVDGRLDTTTAWAGGALTSTSNAVEIGGNCNGHGGLFWSGQIDEARAYSRVLSAAEIKALYDRGTPDKVNSSVSTPQGTGRLDSDLAAYWKLDEGTGTSAADSGANAFSAGTLTSGPTWGTGRIGSAVDFDGVDDHVLVSNPASLDDIIDVTLCAWVNPDGNDTHNYGNIVSRYSGGAAYWDLYIDQVDSNLGFGTSYNGNVYAERTSGLPTGSWTHICGVQVGTSGSGFRLYQNGSLVAATDSAGSAARSSTAGMDLAIGDEPGSTVAFSGLIDEVRVYRRVLSDDEIRQVYSLGVPTGTDTSLKGYWSFNGQDTVGTTAYDRSGAGNDGTLTNGPTVARGKLGQGVTFDGTNDYISVGTAFDFSTASFTLTSWVKPTNFSDFGTIIAKRDTFASNDMRFGFLLYSGTGEVTLNCGSGTTLTFDYSPPTNEWTHLALVVTTTSTDLYANGSFSESLAGCTTYGTDATAETRIGSVPDGPDAFTGAIDEVRAYSRILSASEIGALYNSGR